jgi:hypothetical protein
MPMDFNLVGAKRKVEFEDGDGAKDGRRIFTKSIIKYFQYKGIVKSYAQGVLLVLIITFASVIATWYIIKEFPLLPVDNATGFTTVLRGQKCPEGTQQFSAFSNAKTVFCIYDEKEQE